MCQNPRSLFIRYVFDIVENYAFNGWWRKKVLIFAKGKISIKSFEIDALMGNGMRRYNTILFEADDGYQTNVKWEQ